jgi:hypothetical protein
MIQLLKCVLFCCSAIAEFLELDGSEERSQGWMLLSTLNLLAAEGNTLVEVGENQRDPYLQDPHISGHLGSGSISERHGSGSGPGSGSFPFLKKLLSGLK